MKIVERAGTSLEKILHKSNPWAGSSCDRKDCLPCDSKSSSEEQPKSCFKRNAVYQISCQTCEQQNKKSSYIGETARSCYERGKEHCEARMDYKKDSHMLKHILLHHREMDPDTVKFKMKPIKFHKSAFERQIHESVLIQAHKDHILMNSKSEYNRCSIPRLSVQLGKKIYRVEGEDEELEREQQLEEEIRKMKAVRKIESSRDGPRSKRIRLSGNNKIERSLQIKRKQSSNEMHPTDQAAHSDNSKYCSVVEVEEAAKCRPPKKKNCNHQTSIKSFYFKNPKVNEGVKVVENTEPVEKRSNENEKIVEKRSPNIVKKVLKRLENDTTEKILRLTPQKCLRRGGGEKKKISILKTTNPKKITKLIEVFENLKGEENDTKNRKFKTLPQKSVFECSTKVSNRVIELTSTNNKQNLGKLNISKRLPRKNQISPPIESYFKKIEHPKKNS